MFLQNFKQIFRGLLRYKGFTFINLLGLSIGIAATFIIFLISGYEKSFDNFHSDSDKIYRIVNKAATATGEDHEPMTPYPTAKFLRNQYPGIVATQIHFVREMSVRIGKQSPFEEKNIVFADSVFFNVFDFSDIKDFQVRGNIVKAVSAPNKAILTQSTAKRYFGTTDPVGQIIRLDNKADVEVVAIVKDVPPTTHLPATMFVSYSTVTSDFLAGLDPNSWTFTSNGFCYVKLKDAGAIKALEPALQAIAQKRIGEGEQDKKEKYYLQSLHQIHFDPTFKEGNPSYTISNKYLTMLMLLGAFIILIACVNYINLSTSLAFSKSREVGIRKTIGASKGQLFFHYMMETVLVTTIATIIGLIIAIILLPTINTILDKSVSLDQFVNVKFILGTITGILLVSFISGVYPALILAGFNPIAALKNKFILPGQSSTILRKGLVVFQFTTSIALIICTVVIARQMNYFHNKELGFKKDAVVEIELPEPDSARIENFRALIQNDPGVQNLSFCLGAPVSDNGFGTSLSAPQLPKNSSYGVRLIPCDKNYLETYGMKLLAGRWFLPGEEKNLGSALVVNEALIRTLGYKSPGEAIGKKIRIGVNDFNPMIIGVTKDFHVSSLHDAISPVAMMPFPYFYYAAAIRINPANMKSTLANIEAAYKKVYPESIYAINFIDETLAERYKEEARDYNLFKAFSTISIFICCIGLWGLIAFVVVRKTKEIGIRKVLGASISNIVGLLSKDFLKLVVLGLLVASPIAWYFMNKWLEGFAYRISISWWVFGLAGLFALVIALITISFQAVKAALANPVKNLRTE